MQDKGLYWKSGLIVLMILWAVYGITKNQLKGGIDLVGGHSLLYAIDTTGLAEQDIAGLSTRVMERLALASIKKYDKVMTIGGIIGTVMEIREDEVILKVDDNTNTRMKFSRSAIQRPLSVQNSENKDDK